MKNHDRIDVLVIEDNPHDFELTIHAVKRGNKNANVIHLWNGEEALHYIQSQNSEAGQRQGLRLIMLDLSMPKLDGLEVLGRLRSLETTRLTPIVILTATEQMKKINEAYRLGANSYVIKPTRFEQYVDTVSLLTHYWSRVNMYQNSETYHQDQNSTRK